MRLVQVAPYVTYPPRLGGDHRTHGLVKEFPVAGDTVIRYCQGGSPSMYRSLDLRRWVRVADNYHEYRHLNPLHEMVKAPMLFGYPNVFAGTALRFASDGLPEMLSKADVVLAREPWQMPFVLDAVDEDIPVVFSSHNVETERFDGIKQPLFEEHVAERVETLERQAVEETDAVVCTSERDAEVYKQKYDLDSPVIVAPNGTYEDSLRPHRPDSSGAVELHEEYGIASDSTVCLFMGSNYRPNVEAIKALVESLEADLSRSELHLLVVGSVGKALNEESLPLGVTVTGYLEERFEAHFDLADVALNPMLSGGGTNIKLIDYFARSLPVVSTPFGARGIGATDGEELIVAELDEFPEAIAALSSDPECRAEVETAGRQLAEESYTWEAASRTLRSALIDLFGPFENGYSP
jgi:glycosyltransferase involved in cell wall biosynthesis